jgi:hypothetical protein
MAATPNTIDDENRRSLPRLRRLSRHAMDHVHEVDTLSKKDLKAANI